ncbi:FAD binding domain-containing protein [Mollisia scopiformis]|uniref:FAD binding domain-containing protein n=1 Tax=Mollisia scopiformis TaxID=149040 RepID=A0A194X1R4_MOLSC|nr:FAD binding domain-containing protein [Mollisia scopiformis]KUJ13782.1 FAD binding domain-containing protein [Mollisia scopiformis]
MLLFKVTLLFSLFALAPAAPTFNDPGYNCRPGQSCWPSWQQWQQLNHTLDGHLYQTIPMGAPCYPNSPDYDPTACASVESNYTDGISRGAYYGQTYWPNWEACGSSGCSLLTSDPADTLYPTCSLGRLATYYVDVRNASHISTALKFAQSHNIRVSVKNTGHDFFGRSSVPNSLAIWTHNLKNLDFYQNFTASNCPSANGQNVGEMGAGVIAGDAYRFFGSHGMDVTGGYEESVGIAGGFGQGGGVGDFTTTYGLMVDNAVEFEVVTADGQVRIINECNDPDLFWAMRGGGGGTFAVLTKFRVQVYPSVPIHTYNFVASFTGTNVSQQEALRTVLTAHANHQIEWSAELITGQGDYFPNGVSMDIVLPYNDDGSKLKNATAAFAQFVSDLPNVNIAQNNYTTYATYVDYLSYSIADAKATEPAGIFSLLASRLMPRQLFTAPESVDSLVDGVITGIETARTYLNRTAAQIVFETPISTPDLDHKTSALPAWREALWHVIHVGEWEEPLSPTDLEATTEGFLEMLEPLKELTPSGGAYFNEAHYGEPEWEETFFGSNYERLVEVKGRYDPTHLFDCWKCVGWRGENDPFYSCYQKW